MTADSFIVRHTFLEVGEPQAIDPRRRTRSRSDFDVEYADHSGPSDEEACGSRQEDGVGDSACARPATETFSTCAGTSNTSDAESDGGWISDSGSEEAGQEPALGSLLVSSGVASQLDSDKIVYMMALAPDGSQMLVPVAMPGWQQNTDATVVDLSVHDLEARASALAASAREATAAARRAAAAAAVAKGGKRYIKGGDGSSSPCRSKAKAKPVAPSTGCTASVESDRTTLMLRNLPLEYTRSHMLHLLDSEGFSGKYCFVYVPTDFQHLKGCGFAFVAFCSHDSAVLAKRHFQGYQRWHAQACDVAWSGPVQGLQMHTDRYRNSPVMHPSVPDEYKPAVFEGGVRVAFPAPTKKIRPPRLRHNVGGVALSGSY